MFSQARRARAVVPGRRPATGPPRRVGDLRIEHLGLTLAEAKQLLTTIQQRVLERQIRVFLADHSHCKACGVALKGKGSHTRRFRTLFGTFTLPSPRLYHCRCQRRKTPTFRPLTVLLDESVAPELLFIATKWASLG